MGLIQSQKLSHQIRIVKSYDKTKDSHPTQYESIQQCNLAIVLKSIYKIYVFVFIYLVQTLNVTKFFDKKKA